MDKNVMLIGLNAISGSCVGLKFTSFLVILHLCFYFKQSFAISESY